MTEGAELALVRAALAEDLPSGDLTTDNLDLSSRKGYARLLAKEDLVLSGTRLFELAVREIDPSTRVDWSFTDGSLILKGQIAAVLKGSLPSLLKSERVSLNFLGHLSGVATLTRTFVHRVQHTRCRILDTRKTLPTFRALEKEAVRHGGGLNHRMNLSDAILVKENHIRAAGGITAAVERLKTKTNAPIEVEVSELEEVQEAVGLGVRRLLLDNMTNEMMAAALKLIPGNIETEASGNMTLQRVASVAELGVTFISIGALTHSAPAADFSLLFDIK